MFEEDVIQMKYYRYVPKTNTTMEKSIYDDTEWGDIVYCCFDLKLRDWILSFYLNKFLL